MVVEELNVNFMFKKSCDVPFVFGPENAVYLNYFGFIIIIKYAP